MKHEWMECDQCGEQINEEKEITRIAICTEEQREYHDGWEPQKVFELCVKCADKIGLIKRVIKEDNQVKNEVQSLGHECYDIIVKIIEDIDKRKKEASQ